MHHIFRSDVAYNRSLALGVNVSKKLSSSYANTLAVILSDCLSSIRDPVFRDKSITDSGAFITATLGDNGSEIILVLPPWAGQYKEQIINVAKLLVAKAFFDFVNIYCNTAQWLFPISFTENDFTYSSEWLTKDQSSSQGVNSDV